MSPEFITAVLSKKKMNFDFEKSNIFSIGIIILKTL